jgi:uncharacterized protein YjiS (DUF1127 family)
MLSPALRVHQPMAVFLPLFRRASAALVSLIHSMAEARRYAAARREFDALDARTLRDIGLSRSEFSSHWLETRGAIEATRRNVGAPATGVPYL